MVNVEKRLTRDGDDSRFSDRQLSAGSHAKMELCVRPTENNFAKLTPSFVWFCRYLSYNDPWLVAGGVLKRNVKVAADRPCPNSYNSNARFPAKARVQGTTLANTLVRNHQQGPDHFDDGFLRERSPRKQQENSTHLRRFHWVLEAP